MTRWIRWQGLIAFFAVVAVAMALWLLFVDRIVEGVIEKIGMSIVGAEVDVRAHVKLVPLGITLTDLQVTNPEQPEKNSFECRRIAFDLDSLNLLRRKVIINEMTAEGMRFGTARKRPGKVQKKAPEEKEQSGSDRSPLPGLPLQNADVAAILKSENVESVNLIQGAKAELEKKKTDWQKRIDEMPDKIKLEAYRIRIEKLRQAPTGNVIGMAGRLGEARDLTRDLEQDINRVQTARAAFGSDLTSARDILARAEQAPLDDLKRLRNKYSMSTAGAQNMTQLLFGDKIASWTRSGLRWYERLRPLVERTEAQKARQKDVKVIKNLRSRGADVRFKEERPLPDLLIARVAVSAETQAGTLAGTVRNITPDQDVLGQPLVFALAGQTMQQARSLALTGSLNHIEPARPEDRAHFSLRGLRLQNLVLSDNTSLPVALEDAQVDLELEGTVTDALKVRFTATVSSAKMRTGGQGEPNPFAAAVRSALSRVSRFQVTGDVSGTLREHRTAISSDLDKVLKNAVGSVVQEQAAKLEQQLKTVIQERTSGQLKELQASFSGLNGQGTRMDGIQNQLNAMLQETLKTGGAGGRLKLP